MKAKYTTENTVSAEFLDTVTVEPVYTADTVLTVEEMEQPPGQQQRLHHLYRGPGRHL